MLGREAAWTQEQSGSSPPSLPDTAACTDWFTRVCSADTGDGVVEPAIVGGVVRPAAVDNSGVVLTVDGAEVCPDVLALGTALETGVVVILYA